MTTRRGPGIPITSRAIAIVDDDASVQRSLGRLLRSCGVSSVLFPSAEEFLARPKDVEFALLIVDVMLGGMGGLDLLEALAAEGDMRRAVVLTAKDTESTRRRARLLGVPVLFKPIEGNELLEIVAAALGGSLASPEEWAHGGPSVPSESG